MMKGLARMLAVAALVALAVPAHALGGESLTGTGSITYTWQGDPTRGCAIVGVCDVRGVLIVQAQGSADVQRVGRETIINFGGSASTIRVLTGAGASESECIDVPPNQGGQAVFVNSKRRGRPVGTLQGPLSSGRCAGPLASDLARLVLPVRRSAGRRPSFDLRTRRTFAAGPFTGQFISTVVLRPAAGGESGASSSGSFGSGPPPAHKVLVEHVILRYRLTTVPEALKISFSGESDPFCVALDSCGATGTVALSARRLARSFTVTASRVVAKRVGAGRAVADFRRGRLDVEPDLISVPLVSTETFIRSDGSRCQDFARTVGQLSIGSFPPAPGTGVFLAEANDGIDAMRTHCPGPSYPDVFGANNNVAFLLARGPLVLAQLLRRHSTLTLSDSGTFSGFGYAGSRAGALGLALSLVRVRAGSSEESR